MKSLEQQEGNLQVEIDFCMLKQHWNLLSPMTWVKSHYFKFIIAQLDAPHRVNSKMIHASWKQNSEAEYKSLMANELGQRASFEFQSRLTECALKKEIRKYITLGYFDPEQRMEGSYRWQRCGGKIPRTTSKGYILKATRYVGWMMLIGPLLSLDGLCRRWRSWNQMWVRDSQNYISSKLDTTAVYFIKDAFVYTCGIWKFQMLSKGRNSSFRCTNSVTQANIRVQKHWGCPGRAGYLCTVIAVGTKTKIVIQVFEAYRESSGTAFLDDDQFGDPVQKAEGIAFPRACARFGLGLYLYHEDETN
eukprot:Gb_08809 [translate_table: standard]